jgi:regulatory protein
MENSLTYPKALDTAYRLLAARPHTRAEIRRKLSRKGCDSETITAILAELQEKGYLNEDDMALRWAQALVRDKLWGPLKISAYLLQKGIGREIIEQVQRQLWQETEESAVAAQALRKRFGGREDESLRAKKAAFLRSRGFAADVIYKISKEPCEDQW